MEAQYASINLLTYLFIYLSIYLFRGAIMFPSYEGYRPNLDLHEDDIRGIQSLYGPSQVGYTQLQFALNMHLICTKKVLIGL